MIYLIGAGGHGKVVAEIILGAGQELTILDADQGKVGSPLHGLVIEAEEETLTTLREPVAFIVALGEPPVRRQVMERWLEHGHTPIQAIHPSAVLSPSAEIGPGTVVMAGVVVQAECCVGQGVVINTGASVDHDCRLEDYSHVAPGAHLGGNVVVGEEAWIGIGASVLHGTRIGARSLVGAGSVVVRDLPVDVLAYGNPCKVVRGTTRGSTEYGPR